jgi:hypothetical protein
MSASVALILLLLLQGAAPAAESVYTDLDTKKCQTIEEEHEGYSWTKLCAGADGYKLHWLMGDERESITVVKPDGSAHPLELWSTVSPAFSSLGPHAEWRVRRRAGRAGPYALIVRFNAYENPEQNKSVSYLVVVRLEGDKVCVTDKIPPGPTANQLARDAADHSAAKPCLRGIGEN